MAHLSKNNPVRFLIESAANGRTLTTADLAILNQADGSLPPGQSLSSYATQINAAAGRVASIGGTLGRNAGMEQAEKEWGTLAGSLSDEQAALTGTNNPEANKEISNMVADLFNN